MEKVISIDEACNFDNHEVLRTMLDAIDSYEQKREVFLKIIDFYERKSLVPIGYILLFINWLLINRNCSAAMEQIGKYRKKGIPDDRISHIIYQSVIKADESNIRARFHNNIRFLQKYEVLFSDYVFNFDEIKKQLLIITDDPQSANDNPGEINFKEVQRPLLIDVVNTDIIKNILNDAEVMYLVYSDIQKFYYLLFFEDLSALKKYIEKGRAVFLAGKSNEYIYEFFTSNLIVPPNYIYDLSGKPDCAETVQSAIAHRREQARSTIQSLDLYYRELTGDFYKDLLSGEPSEIKIMLITSELTEVNKYIVKNWQSAFNEIGYCTKLLIEDKPYEKLCHGYVYEQIHEFRPHIVFHINYAVDSFFDDSSETGKNLLWIMRYRDSSGNKLHSAERGYKYNNMFILPLLNEWKVKLNAIGIPESRIFNTVEGVNINLFKKMGRNDRYACDIVSVNNAVGGETFRINYYLESIKDDYIKKIILEMVADLQDMVSDERLIFITERELCHLPEYENIMNRLNKKLLVYGNCLSEAGRKHIEQFFMHIIDSLCRKKIHEWIIESGITSSIKFWGKGWNEIEKFRKFHMGTAKHGDELAAIYENSSISISDSNWGFHERNFEISASGGFPLMRHVKLPEVEISNDITRHFKEDEEIVLFYSRDDLLNKIQYYLDNPDERERIAEKGRQVVINNFSHVAVATKTMDFIKRHYS